MSILIPPTPFTEHPSRYTVSRNPGLISYNHSGEFEGLATRYCYFIAGNYILTQQAYRFFKYKSFVPRYNYVDPLFEFTFRGANFRVFKDWVDCDCFVDGAGEFKYFRGKKQFYHIKFPSDKPFDIRNIDHVVNATMYVSALSLVKTRRGRQEDLIGLEYPPLIDIYQTYRDTTGESWDE